MHIIRFSGPKCSNWLHNDILIIEPWMWLQSKEMLFLLFTKAPESIDADQYSIRKKKKKNIALWFLSHVKFYNQSNVFCGCLPKVCLYSVVMSGLIPHTRYKRVVFGVAARSDPDKLQAEIRKCWESVVLCLPGLSTAVCLSRDSAASHFNVDPEIHQECCMCLRLCILIAGICWDFVEFVLLWAVELKVLKFAIFGCMFE